MANRKIIFRIFIYIIFVFVLSTYLNLDNSQYFSDIITFLSVTIGFSITALSIIATSQFSKELYKKEDKKNNSKTLLHTLIDKFKIAITVFLGTIVSILIFYYLDDVNFVDYKFWKTHISIKTVLVGNTWLLTILSIYHFVKVFNLFTKFIIKNSKIM